MLRVTHLEVPKRERFCINCKNPFKVDMHYVSSVNSDRFESWQREDYCDKCWDSLLEKKPRAAFWKSQVLKRQDEMNRHEEGLEKLIVYLKEFSSGKSSFLNNDEAYFLALYLVRKKALTSKNDASGKKGGKAHFIIQRTGEAVAMDPVSWKDIDPEAVQKRLKDLLGI